MRIGTLRSVVGATPDAGSNTIAGELDETLQLQPDSANARFRLDEIAPESSSEGNGDAKLLTEQLYTLKKSR
jgi:hypothetical protein